MAKGLCLRAVLLLLHLFDLMTKCQVLGGGIWQVAGGMGHVTDGGEGVGGKGQGPRGKLIDRRTGDSR